MLLLLAFLFGANGYGDYQETCQQYMDDDDLNIKLWDTNEKSLSANHLHAKQRGGGGYVYQNLKSCGFWGCWLGYSDCYRLHFPNTLKPIENHPITLFTLGDDASRMDYIRVKANGKTYQWGGVGGGAWCMSTEAYDSEKDSIEHCYYAFKLTSIGGKDVLYGYSAHENVGIGCYNSCPDYPHYINDGWCDDGGHDADYDFCPYGGDCIDCGSRAEISVGSVASENHKESQSKHQKMMKCHMHAAKEDDCSDLEDEWLDSIEADSQYWHILEEKKPDGVDKSAQMDFLLTSKTLHTSKPIQVIIILLAFVGAGFILWMVGKQCSKNSQFQQISSEI